MIYRLLLGVFLCGSLFAPGAARAQEGIDTIRLRSLRNVMTPFASIAKKDSVFLICFWQTTSEESLAQLNAINAQLEQWQNGLHFRMLAISLDEGRAMNRVRPTVNANGWTFEVFTDTDENFHKAVHAQNMPMAMILYRGKIFYQQSGYSPGSEKFILDKLLALKAGKN